LPKIIRSKFYLEFSLDDTLFVTGRKRSGSNGDETNKKDDWEKKRVRSTANPNSHSFSLIQEQQIKEFVRSSFDPLFVQT